MPLQLPEHASYFAALHRTGFLLPNAWDAASARIFENAGCAALGTTSAGIAYSRGQRDGQRLSRDEMLRAVSNIVDSVNIPVNADIEAGYGSSPADVARTVSAFVSAGVAGLNLEDATSRPEQPLYTISEQQRRLEAARNAADRTGAPIFLTARTDTYLTGFGRKGQERLAETGRRGRAALDAGADLVFVPGLIRN
ncbi:isocitrate lyase/phosphoenolpyruvate mutase family protein [Deinococcus radiomollis]|uniref:isocitrate lyase/PEP mutase family protein n=1 Tax=Deinococcus radiomollis TaxID=468916 RepID=UPI003891C72D